MQNRHWTIFLSPNSGKPGRECASSLQDNFRYLHHQAHAPARGLLRASQESLIRREILAQTPDLQPKCASALRSIFMKRPPKQASLVLSISAVTNTTTLKKNPVSRFLTIFFSGPLFFFLVCRCSPFGRLYLDSR